MFQQLPHFQALQTCHQPPSYAQGMHALLPQLNEAAPSLIPTNSFFWASLGN